MAAYKLLEISTTENGTYTDVTDIVMPGNFSVSPIQFAPKRAQSPLNGKTFGGLVSTTKKIDATCNPLTQTQTETLLPLISPEYVWVNYRDPELGWRTGIKMLSANAPATALSMVSGVIYWDGVTFSLTEV